MDDVDLILEGMERELKEQEAEISVLGDRFAAGQNVVRSELNAAIRQADHLGSEIVGLKREYDRFSPMERGWQAGCGCGTTSGPPPSREEVLGSQKRLAQLEMQAMPQLSALTSDAVELLASAWNHPHGEIESCADFCAATRAYWSEDAQIGRRSAAQWRAAAHLLEDLGLAERAGAPFECNELTWIGYRVAGMIHRGGRPPEV